MQPNTGGETVHNESILKSTQMNHSIWYIFYVEGDTRKQNKIDSSQWEQEKKFITGHIFCVKGDIETQ